MSAGPTICAGAMIKDLFDTRAIWDELLCCHHIFKFIHITLSKSPLLGAVDLLVASRLELGLAKVLDHMLLVLQLGTDGHDDLANVDPGHCTLGLSKDTTHYTTCLEPRFGTACNQIWMSTGKACCQGPIRKLIQAIGCIHHWGGCCLRPLHTGPPKGKEHSWLSWLQIFLRVFFF